jgi:hypothetical protein
MPVGRTRMPGLRGRDCATGTSRSRGRRAAWAAAALAAATVGVATADDEASPGIDVVSRGVAVRNVCAWPNLTLLPDGAVVATIFNQPCHGTWEGDVDCHGTTDDGATWQLRGTPAPHEPTTNRMNVAAGRSTKGDLVVLASGWSHRPPPPPAGQPAGHGPPAAPLPIQVCRSADGGATWTRGDGVELPSRSRLAADRGLVLSDRLIPFGDVIEIGGGLLGACVYAGHPDRTNDSYFFTSADDGRTWRIASVIARGDANETAPVRLSGGELLACARTVKDQHLELLRSTDNGSSWAREAAVSKAMQHPAHLLVLADGRVLLTYGDRTGADWSRNWPDGGRLAGAAAVPHGILVRMSGDSGRTWSEPARIAGFDGDGGYPATVELVDGRLLTAYYARRTPRHDGYQMATVTWRPPAP